jgi:DNA-binding GntR family transcriptional regulator
MFFMTAFGPAPRTSATLAPVGRLRTVQRTSDRVYDELVSAIRDLRIPPGASLPETEVAEQLHVSRTPLREAIARLVDNGLVSVIPQVGTRVQLISLNDVAQAQFIRESLELAAFAEACGGPSRDVRALQALLSEQEHSHAQRDTAAFFAADEALHEEIFTISGYPAAWRVMQPMKLQLDRLRRLSLPDPSTVGALIDEHRAIVDALEAGDRRRGSGQIRKHVRRVLDYGPALRAQHPDYFTE